MKKILLAVAFIISSFLSFSQSVTILPTSTLGGGGSQWTTVGNNITYGDGINNNVGIGTTSPLFPLVVRQNNGANDQPVFLIERANSRTPFQGFVKYGGTTTNPQPVTPGELGVIAFGGSTSNTYLNWAYGASIRAVARGIFSGTNFPGQLEFSTTPASSTLGPQVRMTINEEGKIGINNNTPISQLDLRYDGSSTYGVHNPMLNIKGPDNTVVHTRYSNSSTTNFSILQEVTPNTLLNNSSIRWRWYDNAIPSVGTTMFQWANNSFDITGGLSTTGNASIGGTNTTVGTSSLRGKVTIGSTIAASAGLEIQSNSTLVASPDIYLKSNNNIIRYGNVTGNAGMMQSVINSATPGSASMAWVHLDNATTPTQTTMMTLDGEGDLTVAGFTKLGGFGADVPAIKTKYFTGTMTTANGGWPAASYDIAHGLTFSKIISMSVLVTGLSNITVGENSSLGGYQYIAYFDGSNIKLVRGASSASITPAAGLNVTFKVLVTYIP
jgi:hypothetical protein